MFEADLAVSATGSTSYELLALGTPTIGIPQADNQLPIAEALSNRGAMIHLPRNRTGELAEAIDYLITDTEKRYSLREQGRELIDGQGTERTYQALLEECG
jgi:spore coat polysaccharide biosynthesis predicted glycosyltransferase SpsG